MNGKILLKHIAKWKLLYVVTIMASLSFVGVNAFNEYKPSVMSDKDDYAPGEIAIITGYGWTQDQYVDVHFKETPEFHGEHQHDYHNVPVDKDGKWMITYQIEERHLGVAFDVTVEGQQSKAVAHTYFTDANVSFNAVGLPNGMQVRVEHRYTPAANGTMLESTTFTTPNTSTAIASANNRDVLFSYPQAIVAGGKTYQITSVTASNGGSVESGSDGYDYKFNSPSQGRTLTANYKKATAVTANNVSGQQGGTVTLSANLKESGSNLSGKQIGFTFNGATLIGTTNNGGNVTVTASIGNLAVGSYTYTAEFLGDAEFAGSSATGTVTVSPACTAPAIATHPISTASDFTYGSDATFSVTASGTAPFSYQWQVNTGNGFINIDGATSATITVAQPSVSMSGYQYQCIVTNSCGTVTSNIATLSIQKATAAVTLANLSFTYDGTAKAASATTDAFGTSEFTFTYDGSSEQPVNHKEGGYAVVATLVNANFAGSATGTLVINKADQVITWEAPAAITYGTALSATQLNASALGGATLTYAPAAGAVLNAGDRVLTVSAAESNNYNAASKEVTLKVNKAIATLALHNLTHTYDGTVKSATVTTSPEGLTGVSISNNGKINADTYEVIATLDNENYEAALVKGNLVINKAEVTFNVSNVTHTYDGTAKTIVVTTEPEGVTGVQIIGADKTDVGSYPVSISINNPNYEGSSSTTLKINPRAVTVTADANQSKVYGAADPELTYQILSGSLVSNDTFSGKLKRAAGENVSTYAVELGTLSLGNNYNLSLTEGTLFSITPKAASVSPAASSKVYGSEDPALTGTTAGFLEADGIKASFVRTAGENVATYTISGTLTPANALGNYDITYNTAAFEITKAKLVVTADNKTKVYGDENPAFTGKVEGIMFNDAIEANYSSVANTSSPVQTYPITASLSGPALGNYDVETKDGVMTVTKAALTVVVNNKTRKFAEANPTLDGVLTGVKNNDAITATYSTVADENSNVGHYAIIATLNDPSDKLDNYTVSNTPGVLNITQANALIALSNLSKVYNREAQAATVTTSPANLAVVVTYAGSSNAPTAAGSYAVLAKLNNSNYAAEDATGTLVIAPKAVTATLANAGKVYDGSVAAPGTSAELTGVISLDAVTASVSNAVYSDANVGSRNVTADVELAGTDKANYTLATVTPATATISQRAITIAAVAKTKVYGNNDPALTYTVKSGELVQGESFSGELNRAAGENVGDYAINQNTLTAGTNYALTYESANLSITPKAIAITADAMSKTYGDIDPALTYAIKTGELVGNDAFTGGLTRAAGENVGSYAITQGTLALSNNYTLTYTGAELSINELAVTVTADVKEKYCGQADPALTFVSSPAVSSALKNGELVSFTGSIKREEGDAVGKYTIGQGSLANSNYSITYVSADFKILGVAVDASESSKPVAVGASATLLATVSTIGNNPVSVDAVPVTFTVTDEFGKVFFTGNSTSDGSGIASVVVSGGTLPLGVYKVDAKAGTGCSSSEAYIPVFDASGSFVTGGGWIESPEGAMPSNPTATGKANFGFVSKYKKGSSQVDGNTEFQFSAGNMNFKSTMHESGSLVIAGGKATYRGTGTVNGQTGFKFTIVAIDGDTKGTPNADKFRIKIVDSKNQVVYDNQLDKAENGDDATVLGNNGTGGGSIVIHEVKEIAAAPGNGKKLEAAEQLEGLSSARFDNYPNAFSDRTTIRFAFDVAQAYTLEVYDIRGALVKRVAAGNAEAGQVYEYELDARNLAEGVYFAKLATGSKVQTIKMLLKK